MSASAALGTPPPSLFHQPSPSSHPQPIASPRTPAATSSSSSSSQDSHHPPTTMADDGDPMELNMSSILQPPPQAQNHDRQGPATQAASGAHTQPGPSNTEDDEWEDEDIMDTTPDHSPAPQTPPAGPSPTSPHTPQPSQSHNLVTTQAAPQLHDPNSQDSDAGADESDGSSSNDDYDDDWLAIIEDHTVPDEDELKEIQSKEETSAHDLDYFEDILLRDLPDEPEYDYGESGRIDWLIDHFAGTKENPNREILMRSPTVKIGPYEFQIKLYPRGNDTDYISVYVECVDFAPTEDDSEKTQKAKSRRNSRKDFGSANKTFKSKVPLAPLHTPLPLLASPNVEKRPSFAAHVLVILYNPEEPRVHRHRLAHHRFCPNSFDWGWTRFHGPYFEIGQRQRSERASLLRHDKLAVTAFIQIIEDETDCLYEHVTMENPWDSFAMTGLQPLLGDSRTPYAMVAALSSWLLFRPFRQFLHDVPVPDPDFDHHERPRPMLTALKLLLASLQTLMPIEKQERARPPVEIEPIRLALEFYGIHEVILKCDVIETWEVIRAKIEQELGGTPYSNRMTEIFGPEKDRTDSLATYRLPIKGFESTQDAVEANPDLIPKDAGWPQLLHIEFERQHFDEGSRSWQKLLDTIKIDHVLEFPNPEDELNDTRFYTLYGLITHDKDLQTPSYKAILRPNGPGAAWYQYMDCRNSYELGDSKLVQRLNEREAVDSHQGGDRKDGNADPCLAYIALYVRDDIKDSTFETAKTEEWDLGWIKSYIDQLVKALPAENGNVFEDMIGNSEEDGTHFDGTFQVKAIPSTAFQNWKGAGIVNLWFPMLEMFEGFLSFDIEGNATAKDVQKKIASISHNIKDHRLVKFWALEPRDGSSISPLLVRDDTKDDCPFGLSPDRGDTSKKAQRWLWYHVMEDAYLTTLNKEAKKAAINQAMATSSTAATSSTTASSSTAASSALVPPGPFPSRADIGEDIIMSDTGNTPQPLGTGTRMPPPPPGMHPSPHMSEAAAALIPPHRGGSNWFPPGGVRGVGSSSTTPAAHHLPIPPPPSFTNHLGPPPGLSSIPPPAILEPIIRPWQSYMQSHPENPDVYIFFKTWDPFKQELRGVGTFWAKYKDRVDNTVYKILKASKEPVVPMWIEKTLCSLETIKRRKTFAELGLRPGTIIIAQPKPFENEEEAFAQIHESKGFAELKKYLLARCKDIAFPNRQRTDVSYALNYYGHEYYAGSLYKHEPHCTKGVKIYFNGNVYRGALHMGQRHGAGSIVYCNGDAYEGSWERDMQHGHGKFTDSSSGNVYEGGWAAGRRSGEGVTYWKRAEMGPNECRICYEKAADAALVDCGHVCACIGCARRLDACPLCRRKVLSALKLWYGS